MQHRHGERRQGGRRSRPQRDQPREHGASIHGVQRVDLPVEEVQRGLLAGHPLPRGGVRARREVAPRPRPVRPQEGIDLRVGQRPERRGHHEAPHALGCPQRIAETRPAAHRLGDQSNVADVEAVEQRGQVVDERGGAGTAGLLARRTEATVGERDARVARRQMRHLLPPGEMIPAEAVREDHRRTRAGHLVVQLATRAVQERHRRSSSTVRPPGAHPRVEGTAQGQKSLVST